MLYSVLCSGTHRYFPRSVFFSLLCFVAIALASPVVAADAVPRNLGDFNGVAVIEVPGNFDALDSYGQVNSEPRRALAREFYRAHGDDYDFLVIFTNFDIRMPTTRARAFFSPARNDVQGIGLPLYDHTSAYSPDGEPLVRLEGTIDLGNHASHVLEPTDPGFETTLRTLTHEMMHRWGAYVHFLDAGIESEALLGMDKSHWSFLLDSSGSTLYGNRWQANGDGTFTALNPSSAHPGELFGRLLSPLELYLMGYYEKDQVPPLKLIEAPGIEAANLPAPGVTIPGIMRTVSIDDIIALEGPRVPTFKECRKDWRMGFVLAVEPGSFDAEASYVADALGAIGRLRTEWEKRFVILTDGLGSMHANLVSNDAVESNPALVADDSPPATGSLLPAAASWLIGQQQSDGRWQEQPDTAVRDTAEAVKALLPFPSAEAAVASGQAWLQRQPTFNHDFYARQQVARSSGDSSGLLAGINTDGGWGGSPGYRSNPFDTALSLQALVAERITGPPLEDACSYLHASQQADGGWHAGNGPSQLQPTCAALLALNALRPDLPLENPVAQGLAWLTASQNGDGGFGRPVSKVVDTAMALSTLKSTGASRPAALAATNWLASRQSVNGSWQNRPFVTAVALQALHAALAVPDLAISREDIVTDPPMLPSVPGEVSVTVSVHNLGSEPLATALVSLYAGEPSAAGGLIGDQYVSVDGGASAQVTFIVPVASAGVHLLTAVVDGDRKVNESDEWNNSARRELIACLPPPLIDFGSPASAVTESAGQADLPVTLSHPWHETVILNYAAVEGGDAVAGRDYQLLSGILSIPPGQSASSLPVRLIDDLIAESDRTLTIKLLSASPGIVGQGQHQLAILDDEPPDISITSPLSGPIGDSRPLLQYASTTRNVQVRVDGDLVEKRSGDLLDPLSDGVHHLVVTATNSLGDSRQQNVDFCIDTSLPVVTVLSPRPGVTSEPSPLLDIAVDGASDWRLTLDDEPLNKHDGERLDHLPDGQHVLVVTAWNAAGTEVSSRVNFLVDTVSPRAEILYPNEDVLRETSPVLFCRVDGAAESTVRLDGVPVTGGCGERLGPLSNGAHRIELHAVDNAGNQAVATAGFVVHAGLEPVYEIAAGWPRQAAKFYGGLGLDPSGNVYLATQDAGYSLTIQKFSGEGELLWQLRPFAMTLITKDAAVDNDGNLFVVGNDSKGDGFVYKFASADGRYLAGYSFASAGSDFAYAVQIDGGGEVVVAGETGGDLFGAPNGTMNVWIARLDKDCRLLAGQQLTLSGMQELAGRGSLALDRDGNAFLAGYTDSATFGPANGGDDAFVAKFDRNLWPASPSLQFGTGCDDQALDIAIDVYGNLYVSGGTFDSTSSTKTGFVYKFDANGRLLKRIIAGNQPVRALVCERDGVLFAIDELGLASKYDSELTLMWSRYLTWNYRYQLVKNSSGDLYAAGDGGTSGNYASVTKLQDVRRPDVSVEAEQILVNRDVITLAGTITEGAVIELVDEKLRLAGEVIYPQSEHWQLTISGLSEGDTTVVLKAVAPNGLFRLLRVQVSVDSSPPVVTIQCPVDGQSYAEKPELVYAVSDGRVDILINGVPMYRESGRLLEALRQGWNTVRVESTDSAGNLGYAVIRVYAEEAAVGEWPSNRVEILQTGTPGVETAAAMTRDSAGNLYLLGFTTGNFPGFVNAGSRDPFIAKYDPAGRQLAIWQFGVPADETGGALIADANGDLLAAWNVRNVNVKGQADYAVFLAKFSGNGTLVWQTELNSSADDWVNALSLTPSGDILLGGETYGAFAKQRYGGEGDYFLASFSPDGRRQWVRLSNATSSETIRALAVDGNGFIYGAAYVGTSLAGVEVTEHVALLKFDAAGSLLQVAPIQLPAGDYLVGTMFIDATDRLVAAGSNGKSYFLSAHDLNLNRQWLTVSPQDEPVSLAAAAADEAGNVYVAGMVTAAYDGNREFGGKDVVTIKHLPSGKRQWTMQFGGTGNEVVAGLLSLPGHEGEIWVCGDSDGVLSETLAGLSDIFLARLTRPELETGPKLSVDPVAAVINSTSLVLSGTTTPGASLEIITANPGASSLVTVNSDGTWHASVSGLQPECTQRLTIRASSELGTTSSSVSVTVDTMPPRLMVDIPVSPTQASTQLLTGTSEPGVRISVAIAAGVQEFVAVDGNWVCEVSGLHDGDNLIVITATDAAGNCTRREEVIRYIPLPPPTLTVNPASIGSLESTDVVLTISGITPTGGVVNVAQIQDLNGNGHVDDGEPVVGQYTVADGESGDSQGALFDSDITANGSVVLHLNRHFVMDRWHAPGDYLFIATTGSGCAVAPFSVLSEPLAQQISGMVLDGEGRPVAGAQIELTDLWEHSYGYALSNQQGVYHVAVAETGDYQLWPKAQGYVFPCQSPESVHLAAGDSAIKDLTLLAGTYAASGMIYDSVSRTGVAGVIVRAAGDGALAETMTDGSGRYTFRLPPGRFKFFVPGDRDDGLTAAGYLGTKDALTELTIIADAGDIDLGVARAASTVCGHVRTAAAVPVPGVPVETTNATTGEIGRGLSNAFGQYCAGVDNSSSWGLGHPDRLTFASGWIGGRGGDLSVADLKVYSLDAWVEGGLADVFGRPLAGIPVKIQHPSGIEMAGRTAADGSYRLGLSSEPVEPWILTAGGEDSGYLPESIPDIRGLSGEGLHRDVVLQRVLANTIVVSKASYDARKNLLTVEASSEHPDAQLQVEGFGMMIFKRLLKGKYYWTLMVSSEVKPTTLTIVGPEGKVTVPVI